MPKANIADDDHPQLHENVVTFSRRAQPIREGGRTCNACSLNLGQPGATRPPSPTSTLIDQVRDSAKAGVA